MGLISGSQVLKGLDRGLAELRQEMRSMDDAIERSTARMEELGVEKLGLYRKLAERRLAQLERGDVIRDLDTGSRQIRDLLEQRMQAHRALLQKISDHEAERDSLEHEREQKRLKVEAAEATLDEREAEVQLRLEQDDAYGAQLRQAHEADAVAQRAEAKTQDAIDDKAAKGAPYESDKLFMYLWNRHFGTSEYSANPVARLLDRWVARLIDYDKARPNYWMLNEIPRRLQAHAESARAAADAEFERVKALEASAKAEMGITELEGELDEEERALAELDAGIARVEQELAVLGEDRARFAAGEDELMASARERLATELKTDGIATLVRHAAATPEPDDDLLVQQISDVDERLALLADELMDDRKVYGRRTAKLRDLEGVRRQFKQHGFDDMRSVFTDEKTVGSALQQFLRGLLDDDDLWRLLARSHRVRRVQARPNFGSGGFPPLPGSWRLPRSRPPGWGLPGPRPGGMRFPSRGGFRRPGGGGFSTGGGF
jgi:chromosome segregation ATPase